MRRPPKWTQEFREALLAHCLPLARENARIIATVETAGGPNAQYIGHVRGWFQPEKDEEVSRFFFGNRRDGQWAISPCPAQILSGYPQLLFGP
jgi:hypothetical protein